MFSRQTSSPTPWGDSLGTRFGHLVVCLLVCLAAACGAQTEPGTKEAPADAASGANDRIRSGEGNLDDGLIPHGGHRVDGRLAFAGQPSADELRALAAAGVRVLDLRRPEEGRGFDQPALAEELGLDYANVPVDAPALGDPQVHRAFKEALESDGQLVVHCASGNRVAGLYYAYLVNEQGMSRDEAKQRAKELGLTSAGVEGGVDAYLDALTAHRLE